MQEILVFILVAVAGVYAFRRVKRALTVGEGEAKKCVGCPVLAERRKFLSQQNSTSRRG